jgi:hypothetical protein
MLLKTKWNEVFIKNRAFLIREGTFNKRASEAYWYMEKGGAAQEVREMFL